MKYIKKISELFDTEELKSEFEMPVISREIDIEDITKNTVPFENPDFGYIKNRLIDEFPFFEECLENTEECGINEDEHYKGCYHFYFIHGTRMVLFSLMIHGEDQYDVNIISKEGKHIIYSQSYLDCNVDLVFMAVKSSLIDQLVDNGFGDIMSREESPKLWNDN